MPNTLLDVTTLSLSTSAAAVTAPADLNATAKTLVCAARSGGAYVEWKRHTSASGTGVNSIASQSSIDINASNPNQLMFYASVGSGTATLELEWWG